MNKKILTISVLAVFMLVATSFVSSAEENRNIETKESPLYRIRAERAINENFFSSRTLVLIFATILLGFSIATLIGSVSDKVNTDPGPPVYTEIILPTSCMPTCE